MILKEKDPNKRIFASNNEQGLFSSMHKYSQLCIFNFMLCFCLNISGNTSCNLGLWEALAHIGLRLLFQGTFRHNRETVWWSCWAGEFNLMCIRAAWITYLVSFERLNETYEALTQRARKAFRVSGLVHDYKWILKRLNSCLKLKIGLGFADVGFFHCKLMSSNIKSKL